MTKLETDVAPKPEIVQVNMKVSKDVYNDFQLAMPVGSKLGVFGEALMIFYIHNKATVDAFFTDHPELRPDTR